MLTANSPSLAGAGPKGESGLGGDSGSADCCFSIVKYQILRLGGGFPSQRSSFVDNNSSDLSRKLAPLIRCGFISIYKCTRAFVDQVHFSFLLLFR